MAIDVDRRKATRILQASLARVTKAPVTDCQLSETIRIVMDGKQTLTYSYILLTALLAKATEPNIDILSLQAKDDSGGAYNARDLCKYVIFPFQLKFLENALDGSNPDPLVNNPARYRRLDVANDARGDCRRALNALCRDLPKIDTAEKAEHCLDFMMNRLLTKAEAIRQMRKEVAETVCSIPSYAIRSFFSDLLDQGFGGASLVLVTTILYRVQYPKSLGFEVVPHPVNQPGNSSRQLSDLDVFKDGLPFLATELKDKPFTEDEVRKAADAALKEKIGGLLFIAGRHSGHDKQTPEYFNSLRDNYEKKGIYIGITGIDAFMDVVLATNRDADVPTIMMDTYNLIDEIRGTPETQMWVYSRIISEK